MKYIKKREDFLKESKDVITSNALDILANNDENQSIDVKKSLDDLDNVETSKKVVCRAAPSPTGMMHIGNLRTMLYNYLFAKKHNGIFYLRIEDTDQKRYVAEAEDYIRKSLEWCGIEPDYAPWKTGPFPYNKMRQSERDYSTETKILLDNGYAYYAFDSESELSNARESNMTSDGKSTFAYDSKNRMSMKNSLSLSKEETEKLIKSVPYVIRFKTPENKTITFNDIIRGQVSFNTNQTDDKVLIKSNGIPTYHMANVCDDHNMGTTHVIRGEEWLPSTPLHILLYDAFGWEKPQFAHLPLLLNPDGKGKLSKRKALSMGFPVFPFAGKGEDDKGNIVDFKGFKDDGFEPDALINFLLMLGWAPDDNRELYNMAEMISSFSLDRVHKAGARFDINKAKWFNQNYVSKVENKELLKNIDFSNSEFNYTDEKIDEILNICKTRSQFRNEFQKIADIFFKHIKISDEDRKSLVPESKVVFDSIIDDINSIDWEEDSIKQYIYNTCQDNKIKMSKIMPNLRTALTGGISGPDLMKTSYILGREEFKNRISNLL